MTEAHHQARPVLRHRATTEEAVTAEAAVQVAAAQVAAIAEAAVQVDIDDNSDI